jgi:hypothetical protein
MKKEEKHKEKHTTGSSSRHDMSRARVAGTLLLLLSRRRGLFCGGVHSVIVVRRRGENFTWGSRRDASRAPFGLLVMTCRICRKNIYKKVRKNIRKKIH